MSDKPKTIFSPRDFGLADLEIATLAADQLFPAYTNLVSPPVFDAAGIGFVIGTVDGPAAGDLDAVLKKYDPATEEWTIFRTWRESEEGKHGLCGVGLDGSDLLVTRSVRDRDTNTQVVIIERIEGVATPAGTADLGELRAQIEALSARAGRLAAIDEQAARKARELAAIFDQAVPGS